MEASRLGVDVANSDTPDLIRRKLRKPWRVLRLARAQQLQQLSEESFKDMQRDLKHHKKQVDAGGAGHDRVGPREIGGARPQRDLRLRKTPWLRRGPSCVRSLAVRREPTSRLRAPLRSRRSRGAVRWPRRWRWREA